MRPVTKPLVRLWESKKHQVYYLGIPKTASSSVRAMLEIDTENDWLYDDAQYVPNWPVFTTMRDPLKRFLSGYLEAKRRGTAAENILQELKRIENGHWSDEHLYPQTYYINKFLETGRKINNTLFVDIGTRRLVYQLRDLVGSALVEEYKNVSGNGNELESYGVEVKIRHIFKDDYRYLLDEFQIEL